jgi:hypothetical protein
MDKPKRAKRSKEITHGTSTCTGTALIPAMHQPFGSSVTFFCAIPVCFLVEIVADVGISARS